MASGTLEAARSAASRVNAHGDVTVINSRNASLGQGLLVVAAAECAEVRQVGRGNDRDDRRADSTDSYLRHAQGSALRRPRRARSRLGEIDRRSSCGLRSSFAPSRTVASRPARSSSVASTGFENSLATLREADAAGGVPRRRGGSRRQPRRGGRTRKASSASAWATSTARRLPIWAPRWACTEGRAH